MASVKSERPNGSQGELQLQLVGLSSRGGVTAVEQAKFSVAIFCIYGNKLDRRGLRGAGFSVTSLSNIGPVSKYLGTRSLAGLGATSGQSLPRTCEFRYRFIDLLLLFFLFEALRLDYEACSKPQDFFWFPEKYTLMFFVSFLLLLLFNPKRLFTVPEWP